MSFWQWHDDPQHVIALITLGTTGFYTGRWLSRPPRRPAPEIRTIVTNRDNRQPSRRPARRPDVFALKAELDQCDRIIDQLTHSIMATGSRDGQLLSGLQAQLDDALRTRRAIADELGDYTDY